MLPSAMDVELRDLRSRLRALPSVSLLPPDDQLFRALIVKYSADRQLAIDESVVGYLATGSSDPMRRHGGRCSFWTVKRCDRAGL